jgi:AcrR family transcriptional regulator
MGMIEVGMIEGRIQKTDRGQGRARGHKGASGAVVDPRARLLEAMLACVGEQGYATTVVADVIAKAGASRKTFYEHFEDKRACFLALSDGVADRWVARVEDTDDGIADGTEAVEAIVGELFALALESPAELRVLAVEMTAAGPTGVERRERVLQALARPLRRALSERAAGSETLARAILGSILRLLYAKARRGVGVRRPRRKELLALAPEIGWWASRYAGGSLSDRAASRNGAASSNGASAAAQVGGRAPGTLSLGSRTIERRGLPRGEGNVSRSFVVHNQRERILDALANLSAAKGFGAITIPEIVQEAAVSVQAFYEHFAGKEDAFIVAYELGHRKALAMTERTYESHEDWPTAVRSAVAILLEFMASEPAYAHLAMIDALTASSKAAAVVEEGMKAYAGLLEPGLGGPWEESRLTSVSAEATVGALYELCFVYVAGERTRELSSLDGIAGEMVLRPFTG